MKRATARSRRTTCALALACLLLPAACDDGPRYWICDDVRPARRHALPDLLSATGLYADIESETIAEDVRPYAPRFALWSDGAEKRRWLKLPPGARIDTSDMDAWIFPAGTQLWKEFTRDGVRVETRLLQKVGPDEDGWAAMAYLWRDDQRDAEAVPYGAIDALGTPHNVPAAGECMACHGGTRSRVLGFSAIQLADAQSLLSLGALVDAGLLTRAPEATELTLPGSDDDQAALGYLHANCSHCHNQQRPAQAGARCYAPDNGLDFHLSVSGLASTSETATYRTMGSVVKAGHAGKSKLFELVSGTGFFSQMPPLARERVDAQAVALLRRWIEAL